MARLRPDELADRLDDSDTFVLDIRERDAYDRGHVEGSRNVPVYDALRGGDEDALRSALHRIPRDREVVTVCKMGVVAKRATRILRDESYDAVTLAGGMSAWRGYQDETLLYRVRSFFWRLR